MKETLTAFELLEITENAQKIVDDLRNRTPQVIQEMMAGWPEEQKAGLIGCCLVVIGMREEQLLVQEEEITRLRAEVARDA